jgi:hypothetical protein
MEDFEKLGAFYLGRPYDLEKKQAKEGLVLYDSKDLVTHAVCVGMTGSGKTGLCLSLLEEAAIDGIPAIIIDPKGDLANLMLTFPDLRTEDFAPWINEEDAAKKNLAPAEYAAQQAELWKTGLAKWGMDGARIKKLREAADIQVYTPGSNAGIPVSILKSFSAPPPAIREDEEALAERVSSTATSLLGLLGIDADPFKSREHILISTILKQAWLAGSDLDIAALINQIQTPTVTRFGAMDVDSFFPAKDRFQLAMSLNNLLAAPSFSSWMEGEPLDIQQLLYTPNGKPRLAIFSIAHMLEDSQRMFFVSLLLNQMLGWMRTQSGTTSLRAILYMDEILGYFPPVANPPSKLPLMTLLKQGRAFGLGVVLVTQNPVDLDYKGLSNTGTWFIGRLQTDRDKSKVIEGLEGVAAGTGLKFDRQQAEQTLAGLGNRIFMLNNVHEDGPELFETRWAMSYLRGPLTKKQIKTLMDPIKAAAGTAASAPTASASASDAGTVASSSPAATAAAPAPSPAAQTQRPVLPAEVSQYFIPQRSEQSGATLVYHPMVLSSAQVRFTDKREIDTTQELTVLATINEGVAPVDWDSAATVDIAASDLEQTPADGAQFADLPAPAAKAKNYENWKKDFAAWLYRNQKVELLKSASLKEVSRPGESEQEFRLRTQQTAREQRDAAVERLRQKYAPKFAALEERKRRAEQAVEREAEQAKSQKMQTAISFGATLLSSFLGRKAVSATSLGRATTAVRGVGRSMKESADIGRAQETVAAISQQAAELDAQFNAETQALDSLSNSQAETLETLVIKPTKANIAVMTLTLAWAPHWHDERGQATPAWE